MKNEPTLVILIPGFPVNEEDSTCLPAQQNLIKAINNAYPLVKLLILSFQYPFTRSSYYWNNNLVFAFGGKNRGGLHRWLLWQKVNRKLSRLKKENNISGILSFWAGECALVGKRWASNNRIKHFTWLMGQDAKKENRYIDWISPQAKDLISISDFVSDELGRNHGITPRHVVPLGIISQRQPADQVKRDIDILCAGSLIPLKQFHLGVDIMREITKQFPSAKMVICGQGPEEKKIRSAISEAGLQANISLPGEKKHPDLMLLMKKSRIFLHFSRYEGFGMVCLEALAAGTPVISFHQPMKEKIQNWFVMDSLEAMALKALSLLRSEPDHIPVYPFKMEETAWRIMNLYGF